MLSCGGGRRGGEGGGARRWGFGSLETHFLVLILPKSLFQSIASDENSRRITSREPLTNNSLKTHRQLLKRPLQPILHRTSLSTGASLETHQQRREKTHKSTHSSCTALQKLSTAFAVASCCQNHLRTPS